jgi:hypothetical protein
VARGTQLEQLVEDLRNEIGKATSLTVGNSDLPGLKQKLRRTQEVLYDEYDWPFLHQDFRLDLAAGERFYDLPTDGSSVLNLEGIETVHNFYSNFPVPLARGISVADYAVYNSLDDVRSDPALKWDIRWTGTSEQIEIWPIPVANTNFLMFSGKRALRPLVADADVADLDDQLLVLWTAGEILLRQGATSASMIVKLAQQRLGTVKKRGKGAEKTYRMGMGAPATDERLPIVVVARAT